MDKKTVRTAVRAARITQMFHTGYLKRIVGRHIKENIKKEPVRFIAPSSKSSFKTPSINPHFL